MPFFSWFVTVLEKEYFVYSLFTSEQIGAVCHHWSVQENEIYHCTSLKLLWLNKINNYLWLNLVQLLFYVYEKQVGKLILKLFTVLFGICTKSVK